MRFSRTSLIVPLLAVGLVAVAAAAPENTEALRQRMMRMKAVQQRMLLEEPMHGKQERKERFEQAKKEWKKRQAALRRKGGARMKPIEGKMLEELQGAARAERERKAALLAAQNTAGPLATNRAVSNPATDATGNAGQSEVSIAVDGNHVVAAWNDGNGYNFPLADPRSSTQGFGWSNDGGITWHDGGIPPATGIGHWSSDPVVTVNEKTHKFYFAALVDPTSTTNGVAVVEGSFVSAQDTLQWGTPSMARSVSNGTVLLDKEWLQADSTNNRLYLIYARFVVQFGQITTNHIDFQIATNPGTTWNWTAAAQLSSAGDAGYVQGARVAVGPAGEVYAAWMAIGQLTNSYWGRDYLRVRKSTNAGVSFGAQVTADSLFANWGSGCPGFNRPTGVTFPGITVDRSTGTNRGRVYLAWNEAINFYYDDLGFRPGVNIETESNGNAAGADLFVVGDELLGQITSGDVDYWKFNGVAGQTVVFFADSLDPALDLSHEMVCSDGTTSLAYSEGGSGGSTLIVFTPPTTNTYYMRIQGTSFTTGTYKIATGPHTPRVDGGADRARDHRDIYVKGSANGTSWPGSPVLASTEPAGYDDYLPEIQIGGNGKPYVAWHAFHDAPGGVCLGSGANIYLARSDDGAGATWTAGSPVTDFTTVWNGDLNFTNIEPNLGDYMGLFANANGVYVAWADGRNNSPDVFMASIGLGFTGVTVSLISARATSDAVELSWLANGSMLARLERRVGEGEWTRLADVSPDGSGRLTFEDRDITAGSRYGYRLAIVEDGATHYFGETWVDVPSGLAFRLHGAQPNPASGSFKIGFTLPDATPAQLELVDIAGRRVAEQEVGSLGPGSHVVDLTGGRTLAAGVYLVRLSRGSSVLTSRMSVVR